MLRELELLEKSSAVKSYEILDYKEGEGFYFLKIKAELIDGSVLYIREFVSKEEYNYSFQWQKEGKLIVRWDNAPHNRDIETFPPQARWLTRQHPAFKRDLSRRHLESY